MEQVTIATEIIQAKKELGALLKELREKAGLTQVSLAAKIGTGKAASRVGNFELGKAIPTKEELRAYYDLVAQFGSIDCDLPLALQKAKGFDYGDRQKVVPAIIDMPAPDSEDTPGDFIYKQAIANPKGLLESAYWLPLRANAKFELIESMENLVAKCEDSLTLCVQLTSDNGLSESMENKLDEMSEGQTRLMETVKCYCAQLAEEALALLERYKKIDEVFTMYASDLPGYTLTRQQFYLGETLDAILPDSRYTRRWAQTLQSRCLSAFQARVKEKYDE